jgi:DNA-binding winged helix-turn-helix (wHTH) protein
MTQMNGKLPPTLNPVGRREGLRGNSNDLIEVGEWIVDPSLDTIVRGNERHKLEPRTMRLFMCLVDSPGTVVSVDRLLAEVWSGVVVGPASVYQAVSQLRKLLRDLDPKPLYVETVPRKGYRLIARVRVVPTAERAISVPEAPGHPVCYRIVSDHTRGGSVISRARIAALPDMQPAPGPMAAAKDAAPTPALPRTRAAWWAAAALGILILLLGVWMWEKMS